MEPTNFIWHRGDFVKWDEAQVHVLTHTLHYGGGVFEGIRIYKGAGGSAIFRLPEHVARLRYSAKALKMDLPYSDGKIQEITVELCRKNGLEQGYIRPLVYYGYGIMGLNPKNAPVELSVACWPWGAYLPHETIDVKVSSFIRIHPRSTIADAKIVGHYVNSILAVHELQGTHYHEALFLDADDYVAEGPGENFFMVKGGELITPPLGKILAGITRSTVFDIARDLGIAISERPIHKSEVFTGEEAFFTGTAAEVTLIRSIDDKVLGTGQVGPIGSKIKEQYLDMVYGRNTKYSPFLTRV